MEKMWMQTVTWQQTPPGDIRKRLEEWKDADYREFLGKLCSTRYPMLGVRLPLLRKLAREITAGDWRRFLAEVCNETYEETMLEGMVLAGAKCPLEEKLTYTAKYISKPDCWALTDSVVPTYRFRTAELPQVQAFFIPYLGSEREFEVRFALIVLLDYFLREPYAEWTAETVQKVYSNKYYVNMARAWILAELAVNRKDLTFALLESQTLDVFTHNKTISKMCDSRRIAEEEKARARLLRRKEDGI